MKQFDTQNIRNVALVGAGGTGKTSLSEVLLYCAGVQTKIGTIEAGNTTSDYDPEEIKRKISIHTTLLQFEYLDKKINLIDTPGYADFIGEVISALSVCEGALFVFDAVSGIGVTSESVWKIISEKNIPVIAVINRVDKDRADFRGTLDNIRKRFGKKFVPALIPIGQESAFCGVVDIISNMAYNFENGKPKESTVPENLKDEVSSAKEMMLEALSEIDDKLLEEYLENKEITVEEISSVLKKGIEECKVIPVVCASATKNIGASLILSFIINHLPSPSFRVLSGINPLTGENIKRKVDKAEPFSGYVFKTVTEPHVGELSFLKVCSGKIVHSSTVYNSTKKISERVGQIIFMCGKNRLEAHEGIAGDIVVLPKLKGTSTGDTLCDEKNLIIYPQEKYPEPVIALAVRPKSKGDQEKIGLAFNAFSHEDPTFKVHYDSETKETVIYGMGDVHLEIMIERLKSRYGVEIETGAPKIPYKETIKGKARAQGKYKKQTGGRGQYGDTWLEVEPLPQGKGFEFVDKIVGGVIPKNYIPSVEKGIREAMAGGVVAGYPVVDVKVTLFDGSYHEVDSSDMAFQIAASMGFKKAFEEAKPVILEPVMHLEVYVPSEYVGDISGDISKRRGKVVGMESQGDMEKVIGLVPLAELAKYGSDLRSMSHGRGTFTMRFSHYQEVPAKTQAELIAEYQAKKEKGRGAE